MSPTARTLKLLREQGNVAEVVEQTIRGRGMQFRRDFIGCVDVIAFNDFATIGVQSSSGSNHAARLKKAKAEPRLQKWLASPNRRFFIHSWAKQGPRGKAKRWQVRIEELTLADFAKEPDLFG